MSGSGATCFALYRTIEQARAAAAALHSAMPDWYFQATKTIAGGE
jgi:4-diphosphocytidyl-2-C-methyl-D-erythritol kinase